MIPEKGQFSFDEVWKKVKTAQHRHKDRLLTEKDVKEAIALREKSAKSVVLAWGGFVPSGPGTGKKDRVYATKLILFYNGKIKCSRNHSCRRLDIKKANKIFAAGPIFDMIYPYQIPKDMPTITNEGELLYPLSKTELLDIMLKNRKYGRIFRWLQENNRVCER